jgi:hypothetical protein
MAKTPKATGGTKAPASGGIAPYAQGTPIGDTGLKQYGGYIVEEYLPELSGSKAVKTYREMYDNDAICGAIIFVIQQLIANAKWSVTCADETEEAKQAEEFIEQCMNDCAETWPSIISEICTMFVYGYAPMEVTFKKRDGVNSKHDDGQVGWGSVSLRGQSSIQSWLFDEEDNDKLIGLTQTKRSGRTVDIPIDKLLLFRTTAEKNNPEGRSILRSAYRSWMFKKRIEEIEGIGVERDMAGLPIARIPGYTMHAAASAEDRAIYNGWKSLVTNIRRDKHEGIVIPSDRDASGNFVYDLSLLSTGGSRTFDTTKIIDRYDRRIATSVLADFLFLGQQAVGSFALSSDKTALFASAVGGFMRGITDTINRQLVALTWKLNGYDPDIMPSITHGDIENPNLTELGSFLQAMSTAGAPLFPDRELENHLRDVAGLPPAPEDGEDERIVPGQPDPNAVDPFATDPAMAQPDKQQDPKAPVKKSSGGKVVPLWTRAHHDGKGRIALLITKKVVPEGEHAVPIAKKFTYNTDGTLAQITEEPLPTEEDEL